MPEEASIAVACGIGDTTSETLYYSGFPHPACMSSCSSSSDVRRDVDVEIV